MKPKLEEMYGLAFVINETAFHTNGALATTLQNTSSARKVELNKLNVK